MNLDKELFEILDKKSKRVYKRFAKFYVNDSKPFINKISRDYERTGFPTHVLKTISKINKSKYDSAVCVLRGAIPYSVIFELYGWKIHYILCGRKNESVVLKKRFNKHVDKTLKEIWNKKVLIIENNSPTGTTPVLVAQKLKDNFNIKKPDLFLDYYIKNKEIPVWLSKIGPFWKNLSKKSIFGKIYVATEKKATKKESEKLKKELMNMNKKIKFCKKF